MYYVYVLKNPDTGNLYYGHTNNLERRMIERNKEQKWNLIYCEVSISQALIEKEKGEKGG